MDEILFKGGKNQFKEFLKFEQTDFIERLQPD